MNWLNVWWQEVSATVANGLQITVIGMALVFLTLGLIILALILLTRLPGLSQPSQKKQDEATSSPPEKSVANVTTDAELAQVAAIAVALLRSRRTKPTRTGTKSRTSRWKQYGRAHQLGL